MIRFIIYLTLISQIECLKCYSCKGEQDCGLRFSSKSKNTKIVHSPIDESIYSCSIRVTPEGLTIRDVVQSYLCRSSSSEYCCNEDLCNSLISPPLPALTSLKCTIETCTMMDGICISDAQYVTVLSSATDSCSVTFGNTVKKSYKKACQPTISDLSRTRMQSLKTSEIFCCNSPECNKGMVTDGIKGSTIQCYTCDSRITGSQGCSIFNESNPHVYRSGSSSYNEACATIVGEAGKDPTTKKSYPSFTIRTFVHKCVSKSGTVSYGGATFRGRIDCCSTDFCNSKNVNEKTIQSRRKKLTKFAIIIGSLILISILIGSSFGFIFSRSRSKNKSKANIKYDQCQTNDVELRLKNIKREHKTSSYPDPTVDP